LTWTAARQGSRAPWLIAAATRYGLPAWFASMTAVHLATTSTTSQAIGLDARIYYRGSEAWLLGGDPWSAVALMASGHFHFAGMPATVELLAPFTFLPETAFVIVAMLGGLASAIFILWKLGLPGSWLLFPPIAQALISANPQLVVVALLLAGMPLLQALAPMLKIYGVIPLVIEMRWKAVAAVTGLLVLSFAIAPGLWIDYVSRFAVISQRLDLEAVGGFSAWGLPPTAIAMVVGALLVLFILDRKSAAWLAVPALWPATQLHYSVFALPVITPLMAFVLAIPQHGIPALVVISLAAWRLIPVIRARMPTILRLPRRPQ
jgi:hypothetical protein